MASMSGKGRRDKAKQNTTRNCTKKLKLSSPSASELSLLPDEIVLSCLARVSRSDHASLSLVSKWHRSVLLSPELYEFRSLMGCTEKCIFLCLSIPSDPFVRWFAFHPNVIYHPGQLVRIRPHLYQPPEASSMVAHGCGIYVIGGMIGGKRSSRVFFLDCRFHTWTNLPSMGVARASAAAGVVDGKIYVLGGCKEPSSREWGEVFDPKTQTWDVLPKPPDPYSPLMQESAVMEEKKVFVVNEKGTGMLYIPSEGIWKFGYSNTDLHRRGWHVIENVMYCCVTGGRILWCDASDLEWREHGVMEWREVKGLGDLREILSASKLINYGWGLKDLWKFPSVDINDLLHGHKLSNTGPNMLFFWVVPAPQTLEIWCAEISLKRRKETGEIWGDVEWSEAVTTLDPPRPQKQHQHHCQILCSLSLNL